MVTLFAADIRSLAPRAAQLTLRLDDARQARVRALGGSDSSLRCLAAGLLLQDAFGDAAAYVTFLRGDNGKPVLPGGQPFNLTHAGDYAVLALATEPVGVDLENIRPLDWRRLSARFFHPGEQEALRRSDDPLALFFTIWTLKESYVKAEGTGFSVSPHSFCILPEGESGAVFSGETGYTFSRLSALPGYSLSVCAREAVDPVLTIREF